MKQNIIDVGLDVDDTQYHGSALDKNTGEVITFKCRPTLKGLLSQLEKLSTHFPECALRLCYEASYIGYTLQRDLVEKGYHCDVVAPTSIPSPRGKQVKTDRIDAAHLVQFYANDLLTLVTVPEPEQEQDRDLIRSRQKLLEQQTELRKHIQALLRRNGRHYKAETQNKTHWTLHHYGWLDRTIEASSGSLKVNLELLVRQLKGVNNILAEYGQQIEALAKTPRYEQSVQALTCYKGIKNLFALTMITEIGDINRFPHPRQLVSWIGMDIREYSSKHKHKHNQKRSALLAAMHTTLVSILLVMLSVTPPMSFAGKGTEDGDASQWNQTIEDVQDQVPDDIGDKEPEDTTVETPTWTTTIVDCSTTTCSSNDQQHIQGYRMFNKDNFVDIADGFGESREFYVHLPARYDSVNGNTQKIPVIFAFHGGSQRWDVMVNSKWGDYFAVLTHMLLRPVFSSLPSRL